MRLVVVVTYPLEKVRHQSGGLTCIGGIRLPKFGTHPLPLHAELNPERKEEESEGDEPAHLAESNRGAEESGQNAGINVMANHGIWAGSDQLVVLLNGHGAAPVPAEVYARPDCKQQACDGDGSSQPEGPKVNWPELEIKPVQRDASCREEDDRDQEDEGAQDARGSRLETLGGFGISGFDRPLEKKEDPDHGKEGFVKSEHSGPPGVVAVLNLFVVFTRASHG